MKIWFVDIAEGSPTALQALLQQMTAQGWVVYDVLPNGVNRWTVIAEKDA